MAAQYNTEIPKTPVMFESDDFMSRKISALFCAIANLSNGFFPEYVDMLTERLVTLFDDVPYDRDGNKTLHSFTYYRCGIIHHKNSKYPDVVVPPLQTPDQELQREDDLKNRVRLFKDTMKQHGPHFNSTCITKAVQNQICYHMSNKKTKPRNGNIGKHLYRIEQIIRQTKSTEADIDFHMAADMLSKKLQVCVNDLEKEMRSASTCNGYYNCGNYMQNQSFYINENNGFVRRYDRMHVSFLKTDTATQIAELLQKGTIDIERINQIISAMTETDDGKTDSISCCSLNAVPLRETLKQHDENNAGWVDRTFILPECIQRIKSCSKPNSRVKIYGIDESYIMYGFVRDILSVKTKAAETIYDAVQLYTMLSSIKDKGVHDYLIDTSCLIDGYTPDSSLWTEVPKMIKTPVFDEAKYITDIEIYKFNFEFSPEIYKDITEIIESYVPEGFEKVKNCLGSKATKMRIKEICRND